MPINKDYIQELLIKPTPDDLNIYRRMGLDEYVSPTGTRYPLAQDYFTQPKKSSINREFVDSLAAGEHPNVQDSKANEILFPGGKGGTFRGKGASGSWEEPSLIDKALTKTWPVEKRLRRAAKEIPKGLARGIETGIGAVGSMARWVAEKATIGDILTKHINIPGSGVVAEYLVRKFGPKKPTEFFDKQMTKYAKQGEKWADFWEEQSQKGWEAPDPEVTQAKWRDMPITKAVATISEAAPNYLAAIASSVLTKSPQTGLLFISALSGAGAYRRQRKAGAGVTKANAIAAMTGAWEYVTELVPFKEVFKPAKSTFLKMLKLGTMEATQEFVQGIGENFLEYFGYKAKDLKSVPAAVKEGLEHTMDGWVENVVAGAGLGVMGGGIVPKGGLYDSKERGRLVRGERKGEEPGRPVQVEEEGEAKIRAGRILQEQVAEIPPTEAIPVPEKPVAPITKPEAKIPPTVNEKFGIKALQRSDSLKGITDIEALNIIRAENIEVQDRIEVEKAVQQGKSVRTEVLEDYKSKPWAQKALAKIKAEQVKPKGKRVISEEAYQKAKKRLTDRTTLRMGVDPQSFADLVTIGAYHVENGLRTFAVWSKKMIEVYGESVKPQLQKIWSQVRPLNAEEIETFPKEFLTEQQMTKAEMGEIPSEGEYQSQSGAFNEHLDYFQNRQLPKTSKIPGIQAQIRTVNGKRLAGKFTAQYANKKIRQLRKWLFSTARKEGVALRMTRGGKISLSVRKAGTYVPEEFAQYGKFKNIRPILGGGQDITRAIQQMDGSLSVKGKLREKGQAGPLERHVLWPTRDISMQKLNYIKEKTAELKSIFKTKKGSKEDEQVNLVLEQIAKEDRDTPIKDILSRKTLRAIASPKVIKQALGLREFYDNLIEEQNLAREMRDQDPIPYRHNYSPHILRDTTIWERLMMTGKEPKDIKAELPDYIKPNAPFNPRAMAREAGIEYEKRVKSAQNLAENYLVTAAKDIFNTSIVQNNKAFIQQLEAMGHDKSANYLADWTAEAYAGVKPRGDRWLSLPRKAERGALYFNRLRNMAVFPLNFSWSLLTQTSSLALTIGRYGTTNTMRGFVQWLNPKIRKQAAEDYYSYIVKSEKQGRITRQDAQNLIGQRVKLRRTSTELARDISTLLLDQLEKLLTGTSIRAAHLHGQKRGLTGEALKNYASDGGAKTQSMYNDEDKPALLRNLLIKTGAPYQTFAYEVVNTMREWAGRTGTPPDTKLYTIWTIIRFLAAASVFAAIGKKWGNKEIWSWKRPPIPFAEYWLSPIIKWFHKDYVGGSQQGLMSPVYTVSRVAKGIDDVLESGSWRKLRNELLKYGPGILGVPGGVQISRTVDAIIAYAQGGVKDRKGRLIFEMEDPQDLAQAIFSGVWSTEGGRSYLDIDYKIKNMTDKELRQYRRKNTYQKTQYPKSKGIIKGRPHKGKEQLIEKIDKELKKR